MNAQIMTYSTHWGSSVHGIIQARRLDWVAIHFSRGSSHSRDWTQASWIAGRFFTIWHTREGPFQTWDLILKLSFSYTLSILSLTFHQLIAVNDEFTMAEKIGL